MYQSGWLIRSCIGIGLIGQVNCAQPGSTADHEYAVYSAVINHVIKAEGFGGDPEFYDEQRPIGLIVIMEAVARTPMVSPRVTDAVPTLEPGTIADLESQPGDRQLEREFGDIGEYVVLSEDEMVAIFDDGGWKGFYRRFPAAAGTVEFSRVGFNEARSQALVYAMHIREGLWGHGNYYVLERQAGAWLVVGDVRVLDI